MPTWRLAEMFVQSNAYKFKEDADEIGEDSGRSHRNYRGAGEHVSGERNLGI